MKTLVNTITLLAFLAFTTACNKQKEPPSAAGVDKLGKLLVTNKEVKATSTVGPAGKTVQSFFKNWEFKRYKQMAAQTVHSRRPEYFVRCMERTPIECSNISIVSEKSVGDDWDVEITADVTDVTCAFAACVINLKYPPKDSDESSFRFTPAFLGIHSYMPIKQTWRVVHLDDEYLIDVCAAGSEKRARHDNFMNYVLDSADVEFMPMPISSASSDENRVAMAASGWLAGAMMNLNIPVDDAGGIMIKAKKLIGKGEGTLRDLIEDFEKFKDKN